MKELKAEIAKIETEIGKLSAHLRLLHERQAKSRDEIKAAGKQMELAQQAAVIDGSGSMYVEARKTFDDLAQSDATLHQEARAMSAGIDERRATLNSLKSRLHSKQQAAAQAWIRKHSAKVEADFEVHLARFAALKRLQTGVNPNFKAAIPAFVSDNSRYAKLYADTLEKYTNQAEGAQAKHAATPDAKLTPNPKDDAQSAGRLS